MKMKLMKKEKKREYSGRDDGEEERKKSIREFFCFTLSLFY
jgi:hypothetical protein